MKIHLKKVITDLKGEAILDKDDKELTIKDAILLSLVNLDPREQTDPEEKYKMFKLSQRFYNAEDSINIKDKDITLIKKCVGKIYPPVAMGRIFDILDGEDEIKEEKAETKED